MEINVKEHNLKEQFTETTERMIQQNNMEIISKRLVDNIIKNEVEELKNEKISEKKLHLLSEAINENDNLKKINKSLHKKWNKKIREFKKIFQNSKRMHKSPSTKRIELKKLIQPATNNLNSIALQKYGVSANFIEKNTQQNDKFWKIYDFQRLVKVQNFAERYKRNNIRQDDKKRKKLREPLVVCKKVFVLAERKKERSARCFL